MALRDRLKAEEGLQLRAYPDPLTGKDPWTIGFGHTGSDVKPGTVWTLQQAESALTADIERAKGNVLRALPWASKLDEPRLGVLIDMAFNMGINGLLKFQNTLLLIRQADFAGAAKGMKQSLWARQVKGRALRLARIMETGVDE